ncbi:MAG: putative Ig domain-containing protein, partial [Candidatus Poseidoniaceae archaeon]
VTISVLDQIPTLSYVPSSLVLTNNTAHADMPLHAVLTGPGDITSWAINDSVLPTGLNFGTTNGTFWGTPTALWPSTSYTVWANNSGGSVMVTVTLGVVDQLPTLSYTPEHLTLVVMETSTELPLVATLEGPGDITSWVLSEALPQGLFFSTTNGTVWGMAEEVWSNRTYTVWANN